MFIKDWKKEVFSIPNLLSFFRILLIPVYIAIYCNAKMASDYYLAAMILAVSCITDLVDGKIARKFHMVTTLGKILDPLADKATQFALILCLAGKHPILWTLLALFVIKEVFQLVAGSINLKRGRMLKGALITGKLSTTILFISLILLIIPGVGQSFAQSIVILDIFALSVSFGNYIFTYFYSDHKFQLIDK